MSLTALIAPRGAATDHRSTVALIASDLRATAHRPDATALRLAATLVHGRCRAVVWWRLAHRLFADRRTRPLALVACQRILATAGADLHAAATVGPGLELVHSPGIVVGPDVVLGARVRLHQNVTLGDRTPGGGQPVVGDDVTLGAGACVLGPVTLGDGVVVAANSVVLDDVPAGCVVAGAPARVVRRPSVAPVAAVVAAV